MTIHPATSDLRALRGLGAKDAHPTWTKDGKPIPFPSGQVDRPEPAFPAETREPAAAPWWLRLFGFGRRSNA